MKNRASITAEGIAFLRMMESDKPADQRICYDPLAEKLTGRMVKIMKGLYDFLGGIFGMPWIYGRMEKKGKGVFGFIAARTRYFDDYLKASVNNGIKQLVILGAGLDTRSYRFQDILEGIKVFEVDHPASQKVKLERLYEAGIKIPGNVTFVAVDFITQSLEDRLAESGYDPGLKTLFTWEGVTPYLNPEAVDRTLGFITGKSGPGSTVIFDYIFKSAVSGQNRPEELKKMEMFEKFTGEGIHFGIEESGIKTFLEMRGFKNILDAGTAKLKEKYFGGANSGRAVSPVYAIVTAEKS